MDVLQVHHGGWSEGAHQCLTQWAAAIESQRQAWLQCASCVRRTADQPIVTLIDLTLLEDDDDDKDANAPITSQTVVRPPKLVQIENPTKHEMSEKREDDEEEEEQPLVRRRRSRSRAPRSGLAEWSAMRESIDDHVPPTTAKEPLPKSDRMSTKRRLSMTSLKRALEAPQAHGVRQRMTTSDVETSPAFTVMRDPTPERRLNERRPKRPRGTRRTDKPASPEHRCDCAPVAGVQTLLDHMHLSKAPPRSRSAPIDKGKEKCSGDVGVRRASIGDIVLLTLRERCMIARLVALDDEVYCVAPYVGPPMPEPLEDGHDTGVGPSKRTRLEGTRMPPTLYGARKGGRKREDPIASWFDSSEAGIIRLDAMLESKRQSGPRSWHGLWGAPALDQLVAAQHMACAQRPIAQWINAARQECAVCMDAHANALLWCRCTVPAVCMACAGTLAQCPLCDVRLVWRQEEQDRTLLGKRYATAGRPSNRWGINGPVEIECALARLDE